MKQINWKAYKGWIVGTVVGGIIIYFTVFYKHDDYEVVAFDDLTLEEVIDDETVPISIEASEPNMIYVEVKGDVKYPGVYELPVDARVKNVLELSSLNPTADITQVNQSMKLQDEMVIYVPHHDEGIDTQLVPFSIQATSEDDAQFHVNINTASRDELMQLSGIGEKTAQKILEYRELNGLFMRLEDIKNVSGIGDKTFLNLEPYITIE